jgi:hypothetical protein
VNGVGWRGAILNALVVRRTMRRRARDTVRGFQRLLEREGAPAGGATEPGAAADRGGM